MLFLVYLNRYGSIRIKFQPKPSILDPSRDFYAIWAKSRKYKICKSRTYMRRQMLKILAGHMMWGRLGHPSPHGGDSSCGPLMFSAFASVCIVCFCPILYFLLLAHIVFSVVCCISFAVNSETLNPIFRPRVPKLNFPAPGPLKTGLNIQVAWGNG